MRQEAGAARCELKRSHPSWETTLQLCTWSSSQSGLKRSKNVSLRIGNHANLYAQNDPPHQNSGFVAYVELYTVDFPQSKSATERRHCFR